MPHWSFKVDINKTFDLIKALITKYPNKLTLKPHIRKKDNIYDAKANNLIDQYEKKYNLKIAKFEKTPNLIANHNIILGFGTSVLIDALYLNKNLLITDHLQANETIYSEMKLQNVCVSNEDCLNKIETNNNQNLNNLNFKSLEKKYIKHLNKDLDILENYIIELEKLKLIN